MNKDTHAHIVRAYMQRMNASDLEKIAAQARNCLDASMNRGNSAQLQAQNDMDKAVNEAVEKISDWDAQVVENIIDRYQQPRIIPDGYWLIWSNEHGAYWAAAERGYVKDPLVAGRYKLNRAQEICTQANIGSTNGIPQEVVVPSPELVDYLLSGKTAEQLTEEVQAMTMKDPSGQGSIDMILRCLRVAAGKTIAEAIPDVLYDGYTVYKAVKHTRPERTTPENVSDTLDAVVRLLKERQ